MEPVGIAQPERHLHLARQDAYLNRCAQYSAGRLACFAATSKPDVPCPAMASPCTALACRAVQDVHPAYSAPVHTES